MLETVPGDGVGVGSGDGAGVGDVVGVGDGVGVGAGAGLGVGSGVGDDSGIGVASGAGAAAGVGGGVVVRAAVWTAAGVPVGAGDGSCGARRRTRDHGCRYDGWGGGERGCFRGRRIAGARLPTAGVARSPSHESQQDGSQRQPTDGHANALPNPWARSFATGWENIRPEPEP